ncbi:hypothetical protein BDR05DRAFT_963191, partial [Suillus weaverae]
RFAPTRVQALIKFHDLKSRTEHTLLASAVSSLYSFVRSCQCLADLFHSLH